MPRRRSRTHRGSPARHVEHSQLFEGSALHRAILGVLSLKVLVAIVALDPAALDAFELPKAQLGHALAWPLGTLLLVAVARYGMAIIPGTSLHGYVAAHLAAVAISAIFAEVPYLAAYGERGNYFGLTFYLDMSLLYFGATIGLRRPIDFLAVGAAALAGTAVTVAYAVVQFIGLDPVKWPFGVERPLGTFGSTVRHGHFLSIAFSSGVALAILAPAGRAQKILRAIGGSVALATLALAGPVGSRGFFIGMAGGFAGLGVLMATASRYSRRSLIQGAAAMLVLLIGGVVVLLGTPAGQRASARFFELAAEERVTTYRIATDVFLARPLTGYGPDSFPVGYTRHRDVASASLGMDIIENSAHNWLLQAAATTGLLGSATLIALLVRAAIAARTAFRRAPTEVGVLAAAASAYFAQGLVAVGTNSLDWIPWLAIGAIASVVRSEPAAARPVPRAIPAWASALAVGVAVAIGLTAVRTLGASRDALVASAAYNQQVPDVAVDRGSRAVEADPGRAHYWNLLGLALTLRERWRESGDAFEQAASRAPYDSTFWQNLARSRMLQSLAGDKSSGGPEASLDAIRMALDVEPVERSTYELAFEIQLGLGFPEMALETAVLAEERVGGLREEIIFRAGQVSTDKQRALGSLERLLPRYDTNRLRLLVARLSLDIGDREAARRHAEVVLERLPGNAEALEVIGLADR